MDRPVPLYIIGLPKDDPSARYLFSRFENVLEKGKKLLPEIIEAKISVKTQNSDGERKFFEVTVVINTSKKQLVFSEDGWDIMKIAKELADKFENELSSKDQKRQKESIRKKGPD